VSQVHPPAYPVWNGVSPLGPLLDTARPGTAGDGRVEGGGHRRAEHVHAVVLVGHPQSQSQVGVGAQVVLDDPGRALCRQDQVQPQGSTSLGDVDDALDEARNLLNQRRELVDDDDQARRDVDLAAPLELHEVLGPVLRQQALAVTQLGRQ